jgi:hypothetical protein
MLSVFEHASWLGSFLSYEENEVLWIRSFLLYGINYDRKKIYRRESKWKKIFLKEATKISSLSPIDKDIILT